MSQEFLITIKTKADLEAAKQLKAQLEQQIAQNKELGKEFETLTAKLKALEQALQAEAAKTAAATEAAEKATEANKELGDETAALGAKLKEAEQALQAEAAKTAEATAAAKKATEAVREQASAKERAAESSKRQAAATEKTVDAQKKSSEATKQLAKDKGVLKDKIQEVLNHIPGFSRLSSVLSSLGGSAAAKAAAGLAVVSAAIIAAKKGLEEYAAAEEKLAGVDAAMAQAGQLTEDTRQKVQALAGEMQKITGIADDEWFPVFQKLFQFGANSDSISRDVEAVKNLAGILGGDLNSAALLITRALQGNFEMFSRYGIVVDEAATQTEKLNKLYEQLAQRGGGQLEAMNRTLNGQFRQVRNAVSDLGESLGSLIARTGVVQYVSYGLATSIGWLAEKISGTIPRVDGLYNSTRKTVQSFEESKEAARAYAEQLKELNALAEAETRLVNNQIEARRRAARQQDEVTDAKMAAQIAMVDHLERFGRISPEEAIRRRSGLRATAEEEKFQRNQTARLREAEDLRNLVEKNTRDIAEAEAAAQAAEGDVPKQEAIEQQRREIRVKGLRDTKFWESQLELFEHSPSDFENAALGIKPGLRTFGDYGWIKTQLVNQRVAAEQAAVESLKQFDATMPPQMEASSARAKGARENAIKIREEREKQNSQARDRVTELEEEQKAQSEVRRYRRSEFQMRTATDLESKQQERQKQIQEENAKRQQEVIEAAKNGRTVAPQKPSMQPPLDKFTQMTIPTEDLQRLVQMGHKEFVTALRQLGDAYLVTLEGNRKEMDAIRKQLESWHASQRTR